MKKIALGFVGIFILLGLGRGIINKSQITNIKYQTNNQLQIKTKLNPSPYSLIPNPSLSIFIPYWSPTLTENEMKYDNYYYFGIAPTAVGEIVNDVGLSNMSKIVEGLKSKVQSQKKVVLRMLNASVTDALLDEDTAQKALISNTNTILEQYNFSGIVLDIEVPFTFQDEKKGQITKFVQQICTGIKANYKTCDVLVYGDYAYRGRPYDLRALGKAADKLLLMAYDFHKAGGEPGPNFPFARRSLGEGGSFDYGYDFKQMVTDTIKLVPKEKIEVVLGMFGYDWTMNEQGKPLKSAQALSLNEIRSKVLKSEGLKLKSNSAKEKFIQYIDTEGLNHIVWYEDEESSEVKTKYLLEQGVSQVSFWAHSYF